MYLFLSFSLELGACQNYQTLNSADRKIDYHYAGLCDNNLTSGWYRFQGAAGTRMPTTCPPTHRCGAHGTGWLNGKLPSVADGIVSRDACIHWSSNCCLLSIGIKVTNCSSYFVYYLNPISSCYHRYCGSD